MGEAVAETVGERFRELYGAEPEGVWAAPGRVNLIGEHTDYNDGFVMPFALPHTAVAAVSRRDDGILRLHSADIAAGPVELRVADLAPGSDKAWTAYPSGVVWALREAGHELTGADVHLASTVPSGAGLSSSAALEVVVALALNDLYSLGLRGWQLARLCQRAENVYVGAPVGIMDQTASACCEAGHALFLDTRDLSQRQIPFDLAAEGMRLLVVDTRVKHSHSEGEYGKRRAGCEKGAALLGVDALRDVPYADLDAALERLGDEEEIRRLVRHIVTENERVERVVSLLESGDTRAIGPVLVEGHASLRDDFRISCPELDLVVDTALAAGALGARMTGGGFGGSAIVLVEAADVEPVTRAVRDAFAAAGFKTPRTFEAVPSAGARRAG
ncbi:MULTISPECIES: galactokinase [Streptomyces]|uniref:Galactokinase n=1 Tax=Streptomyces olivaceus TaxID=47716 RepID=A0ABS7WDX6_STROV|nr:MULTISPECIES: galactokinase [Streptomyces]AOW87411.1 galactokinase [Streptomyces olivaceus]MBZ6085140.1 galactokinase [Streptomyces olivaceus]MBZ6092525.1 galactokinase [Streptomyces olivaceus]MBZ6099399.1 galactokinase [Streptomyces olivaceus]MBZ6107632.1 galactokinase [Streptomyces olivaceus]